MNRREFLTTGAVALPVIERTELLTREGAGWVRLAGEDAKAATFAFYGSLKVTTKDLMRKSWDDAEQDLRHQFEQLVVELRAFHGRVRRLKGR